MFCTRHVSEKIWEHNGTISLYEVLIDCKNVYSSFRGEELYNILIEFGIYLPMKLQDTQFIVRLVRAAHMVLFSYRPGAVADNSQPAFPL
jgi:hypothetical protein